MKSIIQALSITAVLSIPFSCSQNPTTTTEEEKPTQAMTVTASEILGNPNYQAICYGGYREISRDIQPTVADIKEDMKILSAMGIKIVRTYNTKLRHASTLLEAITQLKKEDPSFEMYLMLGAWIDCKNAWTDNPNHNAEDVEANTAEIERAVKMAQQYPDIVKIIAVGNEAMVKWAAAYHVQPGIILKWVNHLQGLKAKGELPADLWITSSDNYASWGGGDPEYHVEDLEKLIRAVDYVSLHTYPMHETHYFPEFWGVSTSDADLTKTAKVKNAMERALEYAQRQYESTAAYIESLGVEKAIHIGETGWATASNEQYGPEGTRATDEYKSGIYHELMREWTNQDGIACFYFEAFDEIWKDAENPDGSENHFGLFTIDSQAKYAIWDMVDQGLFESLGRNGHPITKTYDGNKDALLEQVLLPRKPPQ